MADADSGGLRLPKVARGDAKDVYFEPRIVLLSKIVLVCSRCAGGALF
jgi:hypothetical protein